MSKPDAYMDLTDDIPGAKEAGIVVYLEYDQTPQNPRDEYDTPSALWTKERNYQDYDERDKKGAYLDLSQPKDGPYYDFNSYATDDWEETYWRLTKLGCEVLFVEREPYNGGMRIPGDSRRADGVIYVTRETIKREWGRTGAKIATATARKQAREYMKGEIETYSQYANGECYGYIVQRADLDEDGDETWEGEELDSCWGFYGDDYVKEAAAEAAQHWIKLETREAA